MNDLSYDYIDSVSDQALMQMIGRFIQHHRLNQNRSQDDVSSSAGISRSTLSLIERGEKTTVSTLIQVLRVLNLLHVLEAFKIEEKVSPIAYAKLQKKNRQRARSSIVEDSANDDLGW